MLSLLRPVKIIDFDTTNKLCQLIDYIPKSAQNAVVAAFVD
jgi:hypothetical protein